MPNHDFQLSTTHNPPCALMEHVSTSTKRIQLRAVSAADEKNRPINRGRDNERVAGREECGCINKDELTLLANLANKLSKTMVAQQVRWVW
jgi:hypothetical protein